jgi:nucleotide-binding universal stress UspA family protein
MRIMVAIDGSRQAELTVELVAGLDLPSGTAITVVTVVEAQPMLDPFGGLTAGGFEGFASRVAEGVRGDLESQVPRLERPGVTVDTRVLIGRAAREIAVAARAWPADLLVAGSRGRGPIRSMLLGSVSAELVREAPCPVLIARRTTLQRILLATDGSDSARAAETLTISPILAGGIVEVACVGEPVYHPSSAPGADRDAEYAAVLQDTRARTASLATAAADRLLAAGVRASAWSAIGDPADQIIDRASATGADVVVLGARGLSAVDGVPLGSVARNVLTHARCSVLVVPPD